MKKCTITLLLLCATLFAFAQSNELNISFHNIKLKLDNDREHMLEVSDFLLIKLKIETQQTLSIEDFSIEIDNRFLDFGERIQLVEVNPSRNTTWKTYQLIFKLNNDKNAIDINFNIKNEVLDNSMRLQFYKNKSNINVSVRWKTPVQANREDKTGVETILDKYVVNLEINSSEPLLADNFKILLNGVYQKGKISPRKVKAKAIIGKENETTYQYDYICEVELFDGINQIKLEVETKHYLPHQQKFYSTILYVNKVEK